MKMITCKTVLLVSILIIEKCLESKEQQKFVYKKMNLSTKLITPYNKSVDSVSEMQCARLCTGDRTCKSFAVQPSVGICYLYKNHVYAGLPTTDISNQDPILYYWQLQGECPISNRYKEDLSTNICYKRGATRAKWNTAQAQCESDGGVLFMIDSQRKREIIRQAVTSSNCYVGATDQNEEGVWKWFNGAEITIWHGGEPDNHRRIEHCLLYKPSSLNVGDINCTKSYLYIYVKYQPYKLCEVKNNTTYLLPCFRCINVTGWNLAVL